MAINTNTNTNNRNTSKELIPDATGTVFVKDHRELAKAYVLKDAYFKMESETLGEMKGSFRDYSREILGRVAEGVKRIFFLGGKGGGVGVSIPDYTKDGNRLNLSDTTMKEVGKAGGIEALGIPVSELFIEDRDSSEPTIILRGIWYNWFLTNLIQTGKAPQESVGVGKDIEVVPVKENVVRKLRVESIVRLKALIATATGEAKRVAEILLDRGLKDFTVKAEEE